MNPARCIALLALSCLNLTVAAQSDAIYSRLEKLKKKIRQSTYYDSAAVFSNGASAIKLAKELRSPGEEGLIYQYYGNFYYYSSDRKTATEYYKKAIGIAESAGDLKLKNSTQIRLAFMLSETDLFRGEIEFKRLLAIAHKNGFVENAIEAYNGLGIIYNNRQIKDISLDFYYKGLRLAEKHHKKYYIALLLNNIALIKQENKQYKEARADLIRGSRLAEELEEYRLISNLQNNLGLISRELEDYTASIEHYKETIRITKKLGFPIAIGAAYVNLGNSYMLNKEYRSALAYTDSAIAIFDNFHDLEYLGRSYLLKGSICAEMNNLESAENCIDSVLAINKRQPSPFNYVNSFDIRSLVYEKAHQYEKALEYRTRFHEMSDSLDDISNTARMADLQVLYGKERVVTQLSEEKTKNKLLAKDGELQTAKWRMVLTIALCLFIVVLGLAYIRYVRNRRKQQVVFSQKLIEQLDEERSRISKDLHDDIGQLLSVVKSKINMYNTGRLDEISGLEKEVGEVIDHTRSISHQLHPSSLEKLGLERSLAGLMERTQSSTGIICSMEFEVPSGRLGLDTETQLYRICQECINNTIKHANALALKVTLTEEDGNLVLSYRDNGIGFSSQSSKDGLGFMTIRERINKINGKMIIPQNPQKGMQLIVRFK